MGSEKCMIALSALQTGLHFFDNWLPHSTFLNCNLTSDVQSIWGRTGFHFRVATKIFEDFGGALNKAFIRGWEPVSIVHYARPGTCINRPLH